MKKTIIDMKVVTNTKVSSKSIALLLLFSLFVFALGCEKEKKGVEAPLSGEKDIKEFVFKAIDNKDVLIADVNPEEISEDKITLIVPYGTDPNGLIPTIEVSDKASIYPESGVPGNFTDAATYTVTAEDNSVKSYTVIVTENKCAFTKFVFEQKYNTGVLTEDTELGEISEENNTIKLNVPYNTDVTALVATFEVSEGATVKVGTDPQISEVTETNFTSPVTYTVTAEDGNISQDYTVTVKPQPSFATVSYYERENRVGAGDFEKPDLFEISDIAEGSYNYTLKIADKTANGTVEVKDGNGTIGGSTLSISDWNKIDDGNINVVLEIEEIEGIDFTYTVTKEQYKIRSWQDLQGMKYNLNGSYTLMNDIELPDPTNGTFPAELPSQGFKPVGQAQWTEDESFKGSFDGQNYVISNFFINRVVTDYVGLFGSTKGATTTIENVGIKISSDGVTGRYYVGGLVGRALEGSTIENCNVTEDDNVTENDDIVTGKRTIGGLVGSATNTTITNSYTMIKVNSTGGSAGDSDVGGLVGSTTNSSITNSYATGDVTGDRTVGGLVGKADSTPDIGDSNITIANSYATGNVTGSTIVGGLVGVLEANNSNTGSYIYRSYATGSVSGTNVEESYVGGLVGRFFRGTISDSYATGSVSGVKYVGGLFGRIHYTDAFTKRTYATGIVTGSSDVGGLGGHQSGGGDTHSYWDIHSTGQTQSSVGTGVSSRSNLVEIEGKYYDTGPNPDVEVFIDWKFGDNDENPWKWEGTGQWPTLYWQGN